MTAPRIVQDSELYGVEFRCVDGALQWRHNAEKVVHSSQPDWVPLTSTHRGRLLCELGWTPSRLRLWAGLLARPLKKPAKTPVPIAADPGALEPLHD